MAIAVIGNGPIGASVARSLVAKGRRRVDLFASPTLWSAHDDVGRITRVVDFEHSTEWSCWNRTSLKCWRELERASGVDFFHECGSAVFVPKPLLDELRSQLETCNHAEVPRQSVLDGQLLGADVPSRGLLERNAGYVNPRELIAAQNAVFQACGGTIFRETVETIKPISDGVQVQTSETNRRYDRVVLCAGAFTNSLLASLPAPLSDPLPYKVSRRTVLLGQVEKVAAMGWLREMPALKVTCEKHADTTSAVYGSIRDAREAESVYILPPIWYEEYGGFFIKIGGGPNDLIDGDVGSAVQTWRGAVGHPKQLVFLQDMARRVLPNIEFVSWKTKNCITTSSGDSPLFRESRLGGRIFVVANCQGKAVMASHAIGDDITDLMLNSAKVDDMNAKL